MTERLEHIHKAVKTIREKMVQTEVSAQTASRSLNILSALMGSVREEHLEAEMAYNQRYDELLKNAPTVTAAKGKSKTLPEYQRTREVENLLETMSDMMQTLKYTIKVAERELREGKY